MKSDIEIAQNTQMDHIEKIGEKLNIEKNNLICYGKYKAKIDKKLDKKNGHLILVTATNPTPYGEGKTTVSIGLGDALNKIGKKTLITLREPSLGPVFGLKGGATGGGYAQVVPMEDINLHFTGDFHAITSANNLLCAAIDNHIIQGNNLDIQKVVFNRCLDVNDRSLRNVTLENRNEQFNITAASEIMAILCLAQDIAELNQMLGNILIGYDSNDNCIFAKDLKVNDAMTVLLQDAFKPNLVQTLEHNPVIIHGGPFANIAHGCNSLVATNLSLSLADYVVTEAGFGSDLGAEKFLDIKCRKGNLNPSCICLVTTIKSLKYNAGLKEFCSENIDAVKKGLSNLEVHINNLKQFNINIIVVLNKFNTDFDSEIEIVDNYCKSINVPFSITTSYVDGSRGSLDLAQKVVDLCQNENKLKLLYDINDSLEDKIQKISFNIYHASSIKYDDRAICEIEKIKKNGFDKLPICVAKTQYSISDDKEKLGYPQNYEITVKNVKLNSGAGFITIYLGNILTMPGLPKNPNYEQIKLDKNEKIVGIF